MSVFDYMKQAAGKDYAASFNQNNPSAPWSKRISEQGKNQQRIDNIEKNKVGLTGKPLKTESDLYAERKYQQATQSAEQGMQENAPETPEERAKREKRERNMKIINGVGTAISGVAGMIGGFTGGYAFPEEGNREDPVEKEIDKGKAERIARAQRYYNFAQAKNKALDDFMKYKQGKEDKKLKDDLTRAQIRYYDERSRGAGVKADNHDALDKALVNQRNRSGQGKSGSGRASDDPGTYKVITSHDGSRKFTFKKQDQYNNALNQAFAHVPHEEPFYKPNQLTGEMKPAGTPTQVAAQYAASERSAKNEKFWKAIKQAADVTGSATPKSESPFSRGKKPKANAGGGITL